MIQVEDFRFMVYCNDCKGHGIKDCGPEITGTQLRIIIHTHSIEFADGISNHQPQVDGGRRLVRAEEKERLRQLEERIRNF